MTQSGRSDPARLRELRAWVTEQAVRAGLPEPTSWTQPHDRPWSTALRFECGDEVLWAKANGPGTAYEPPLLQVLADVVPDLAPELVAVDVERRWTLMRDAGVVLRSTADADQLWEPWAEVVQEYAAAQLALAAHLDRLLATGVEDLRPATLPGRLAELVEALAARPEADGGLSPEDAAALRATAGEHAGWCEELAASGVPSSVNHDDLHSHNVCVRQGRRRVIDWGDTSLMHPFCTMLATMNSLAWHARVDLHDPRVERVRDAYLEVFGAHGTAEERRHWVVLSRRVGCLSKALAYVRALGDDLQAQAELEWPVRAWLLGTLHPDGG